MQNQKVIEHLGYTPKEAKVYLASLALGEAHISDIAEKLKMPRSTVQAIVERLHSDGLMNFYVMRRYKYWVAEDPSVIMKKIDENRELFEEAIPRLRNIKQKAREQKKMTFKQEDLGPLLEVGDGMLQPVLIANKEYEILYVNTPWEEQFGYTSDEMCGQPTNVLKSGKTPRAEYVRLWKSLKDGNLFESSAIIDRKKDGTLFNLFTIIFPVKYANRQFYVQILEVRDKGESNPKELKQEFTKASE